MLDYSHIKSLSRKHGLSVVDLIALAPGNDPFYVGAKGQLLKGKWFAKIYEAMGSPERCHTRRVHYWLVTTKAIPKPNGEPYQNTDNDWCLLCNAAKYARYLGLVPIENIIDRRNPPPQIHARYWPHRKASDVRDSIDEDNIISSIVDQFWCYNPSLTQSHMVELWAEKSTMNDVLEPIAQKYGLNLVTGLGELSITAVYLLANRIAESARPVRIFYISDFDPAGECMPVSIGRKIEYFVRKYGLDSHANRDIKLIPLMLTAEQCKEYDLPRTPIKNPKNDHPGYIERRRKFQDRHGSGATELDAMEALHPGEMSRIIEEAIEPYFDVEAWNAAIRKNRELMDHVRQYLLGGKCLECDGTGTVIEEMGQAGDQTITNELVCPACDGIGTVAGRIGTEIMADLQTTEFDSYVPPSVTDHDDSSTSGLYDSRLDYVDQIDRYRSHQRHISDTDNLIDTDEL